MADILDEVRAASPGVARRSSGEMMLPYRCLQCMKGCAMAAGMKRSSTRSRPPRFLVKNISIVSNIAHTVGAGSHSINPPCGWPRLFPPIPPPPGPGSPCGRYQEDERLAHGTVKWFDNEKGYGFIRPDDGGNDVFVHVSAVESAERHGLNEGQKVLFEVVADRHTFKVYPK
jgi:cold shock protein